MTLACFKSFASLPALAQRPAGRTHVLASVCGAGPCAVSVSGLEAGTLPFSGLSRLDQRSERTQGYSPHPTCPETRTLSRFSSRSFIFFFPSLSSSCSVLMKELLIFLHHHQCIWSFRKKGGDIVCCGISARRASACDVTAGAPRMSLSGGKALECPSMGSSARFSSWGRDGMGSEWSGTWDNVWNTAGFYLRRRVHAGACTVNGGVRVITGMHPGSDTTAKTRHIPPTWNALCPEAAIGLVSVIIP